MFLLLFLEQKLSLFAGVATGKRKINLSIDDIIDDNVVWTGGVLPVAG